MMGDGTAPESYRREARKTENRALDEFAGEDKFCIDCGNLFYAKEKKECRCSDCCKFLEELSE